MEVKEDRLAFLHKRSPVLLYTAATIKETASAVYHGIAGATKDKHLGGKSIQKDAILVTSNPQHALSTGDVVISFYTTGKTIFAPPQFDTPEFRERAAQKYPDSESPIVSFLLLDTPNPEVLFQGFIPVNEMKSIILVGYDIEGKRTGLGQAQHEFTPPTTFIDWYVKVYQQKAKYRGL